MAEKLTRSDIEKIQAEIDDRKYVQRPKLIEEVKETRAQGDLSENFEYHEAKRAKNRNESRIRYLENVLKNAIILEDAHETGTVGMNDSVTLYFPDDGLTETYKLVTSIRSDSASNKISIESPVGAAIKGHAAGDTVHVTVSPEVSYDVIIKEISHGDAQDDTIQPY